MLGVLLSARGNRILQVLLSAQFTIEAAVWSILNSRLLWAARAAVAAAKAKGTAQAREQEANCTDKENKERTYFRKTVKGSQRSTYIDIWYMIYDIDVDHIFLRKYVLSQRTYFRKTVKGSQRWCWGKGQGVCGKGGGGGWSGEGGGRVGGKEDDGGGSVEEVGDREWGGRRERSEEDGVVLVSVVVVVVVVVAVVVVVVGISTSSMQTDEALRRRT